MKERVFFFSSHVLTSSIADGRQGRRAGKSPGEIAGAFTPSHPVTPLMQSFL
jgi:hypothetical protein